MKFALISVALFIVASMLFMGEVAWLILLGVVAVRVATSPRHLALRCAVIALCGAILSAHFAGYKVYGSARIQDNRPVLDSPSELVSFAAPNIVLTAEGVRHEVRGVTFTPALLAIRAENLPHLLSRVSGPVLVQADRSTPSGVVFQRRCEYGCGNTFFPRFAPPRLPAYSKTDLGDFLARYELATIQPE